MTLLDAWELAAREFEPSRYLWTRGAWIATVEASDRLRVDGPAGSLTHEVLGVDLEILR